MPRYNYDRLSVQDNSFLLVESANSHMHVSSTLIYEAGPLRTVDGGIDINRIMRATESYLHRIPRYRQKLHMVPFFDHAVWVDDRHFKLDYHVRHTALPDPGTDEQLQALSSRVMAQPLDRARPLWETWIVEGLEGDRFAVITKIHHCMIDGMAGQDLAQILHSTEPGERTPEAPKPFVPRPRPSDRELLKDEVGRYLSIPGRATRGIREATREINELRSEFTTRAKSMLTMVQGMRDVPTKTPLNEPIGPHRRFDWRDMPLEDVKVVRKAIGCTINDLVLAIVTGAVREFLIGRGHSVHGLDFRIAAPVSIRSSEDGAMGNRVSQWFVRAPVEEDDPLERVEKIREVTEELKASNQALDADLIMSVAEWTPTNLLTLASRSASGAPPYNMMVTNVPGPQFPLYLLGARLVSLYSQVPIADATALGVALVSYDGKLCWGFNADYGLVPDLDAFADLIEASFREVAQAAGVTFEPGEPG